MRKYTHEELFEKCADAQELMILHENDDKKEKYENRFNRYYDAIKNQGLEERYAYYYKRGRWMNNN